jgi:hypothetical protein
LDFFLLCLVITAMAIIITVFLLIVDVTSGERIFKFCSIF